MSAAMAHAPETRPLADTDPRWRHLLRRDPTADGDFVYAVRTTGVFCRPSCGARLPNPGNVRFFPGPAEAAQAGFRPCKRCKPDQPAGQPAARIAAICRRIEQAEDLPSLADLASQAGLSPFHFHRVFREATGLTPRAYATAHRTRRVQAGLSQGAPVTQAIYDAGYNASSRFYAAANGILGMTPTAYRAGGAHMAIHFATAACALGTVLVAATERGVCAILLGDSPDGLRQALNDRFPHAALDAADAAFGATLAAVVAFVEQPRLGLDLPLDVQGTAFQHRVWQALRAIPAGSTASYTEIAARIGAPKAARAVASACAANTLAVAIPCHRVVRTGGAISGYRWGVARKRALLAREAT